MTNARDLAARLLGVAIPVLLVLGACASWFSHERAIPLSQIQDRVERRFPFKRAVAGIAEREALNPLVRLDSVRNRIAVNLDLNVRLLSLNQTFSGRTTLSGLPAYDENRRAFVLRDARIDALSLGGVPRIVTNEIRRLIETASFDLVGDIPVYTVDPADARRFGTELTARDIRVEPDRVVVQIARR